MASKSKQRQADPERQLMIKTKTCQRLIKEVAYYEKETNDNEAQLAAMKQDTSKTPHDVKKFTEVVDESRMMIPDSKRRLKDALRDLEQFVNALTTEVDRDESTTTTTIMNDNEWYTTAKALLEDHGLALPSGERDGVDDGHGPATMEETNLEGLKEGEAF